MVRTFGDFYSLFYLVFYVEIIIDCGPKPLANKSCIKEVRKQNIKE
jgi:hypothetical protein